MSTNKLQPELLGVKRRPGVAAAAIATALGGAVGATAVGIAAWHVASPSVRPSVATVDVPALTLPELSIEPAPAPTVEPIAPASPFSGRAAHVVHGTAPMVSLVADAPVEWQKGTPTLIEADDFSRTLRREVTRAVPAAHRNMVGTRAVAVDEAGKTCEVTLGSLAVIGKYFGEDDAPETRAARVEAWDYTEPTLVAELAIPESCGDVSWVILPDAANLGEPAVQSVDAKSAMHNAIVSALRDLPAYKKIQKEWEADGRVEPWDTYESTFALIGGADGGIAVASAGITGCESVTGVVSAIWRTRDGALAERIATPDDLFISKILGAADLNGDGIPEIIFEGARLETGVLVSEGGRYTAVEGPTTLSHICPC